MKHVRVEGWKFALHSFALVNQWQMISLAGRADVELSHVQMPFLFSHWKSARGIFDEAGEGVLENVPGASATPPDITYRIFTPYDFRPAPAGRTVVFATSEYQVISDAVIAEGAFDLNEIRDCSTLSVVTPSKWSSECFCKLNFRPDQIHVVPHGVATEIYYPSESKRTAMRNRIGATGFLFGNFSGMVGSKGIDILLRAFDIVAQSAPDVQLLLKGTDALYSSTSEFRRALQSLPDAAISRIKDKFIYTGAAVSMEQMSELYCALDCYVSPYRAEGFNLPPLEAAACGVPVICTDGGSTDDFLTVDFARFISSEVRTDPNRKPGNLFLEPSVDHLAALMLNMIADDGWRQIASAKGPAHVRAGYTWDHVVDQLVAAAF